MFPVSRRELLGRTVLGVQILLLAACGGDDEDDAEQPRAAPTAPQASVPKLAREPVTLRLASVQDQFAGVVERSIKQWNEGGVPGAPEDVLAGAYGRSESECCAVQEHTGVCRECTGSNENLPNRAGVCWNATRFVLVQQVLRLSLGLPQRSCPAAGPVPAAGPDGAIGELPAIRAGISPLPEPNDGAAGRP